MAVVGAYALGANGQVLSGKLLRLALGAAFRPAATGVQVISGVLAGPPNTMGELTLLSNTQLTVQPYRAVVQNTQDATAGAYEIPNDAVATLGAAQGFSAQDATQFRRALITTYVDDAQVAGSGANQAYLTILPGALAASAAAAALPTIPANALNFGELLIPPVGQTVTLTPYSPRTGIRHGILPVINDASTITGHDGAAPLHDGAYRDHPTYGMQRGTVAGGWSNGIGAGPWTDFPVVGPPYFDHYQVPVYAGLVSRARFQMRITASREVRLAGWAVSASATAAGAGSIFTAVGGVPAAFRPPVSVEMLVPYVNGAIRGIGRLELGSNGVLYVGGDVAAATYWCFNGMGWELT
jgi:hypothetical protein